MISRLAFAWRQGPTGLALANCPRFGITSTLIDLNDKAQSLSLGGFNMRLIKTALLASVALFLTIAVIGHATMPDVGFNAVATALNMEGTFKEPAAMGRAITNPDLVWAAFWVIAATEAIAAALCWLGALNLARHLGDASAFNRAKRLGLTGLGLTALLYVAGFHAIAGEWFLMWQNSQINVLPDAFRNSALALLLMLVIGQEDR